MAKSVTKKRPKKSPRTLGRLPGHVDIAIREDFLQRLPADPMDIAGGYAIAYDYLRKEIYSKFTEIDPTEADSRRNKAIIKFMAMNDRNRSTNLRLICDTNIEIASVNIEALLSTARSYILRVLGEEPNMEAIFNKCQFTNGASTRIRRSAVSAQMKYTGKPHVTLSAHKIFNQYLHWCESADPDPQEEVNQRGVKTPLWRFYNPEVSDPEIVSGNVLFTVPKNAEIDRVACKEPEINMFLQRGVGLEIRNRLRKFTGIDLTDQSKNQELAYIGSKSDSFATLDLSSASDTISTQLVAELLPPAWFVTLDALRSHFTNVNGEDVYLHMFSSMGNGFTFELETLLFWALSCAINRHVRVFGYPISVYGDDIITNRRAAPAYPRIFSYLGFIVNTKKSFWEWSLVNPNFRESCGKHYADGRDVTPFYIREPVTHVTRLIHFLNQFRAWAIRVGCIHEDWASDFFEVWSSFVPKKYWGGKDCNDISCLVTDHTPRARLITKPKRVVADSTGGYLQWLHKTDSRPFPRLEALETSLGAEPGIWISVQNRLWYAEASLDVFSRFSFEYERLAPVCEASCFVEPG